VKGIDTNLLARFLVGDDEQQGKQVYQILKQAEADKREQPRSCRFAYCALCSKTRL